MRKFKALPGRKIVNYPLTMRRFYKYIESWNARNDLKNQIRGRYGSGGCHMETAMRILHDYLKKYEIVRAWHGRLKVTRTWLAKEFCAPRTIYNHLARLLKSGLITNKSYSLADFENGSGYIGCLQLEINPSILVYEEPKPEADRGGEVKPIRESRFFARLRGIQDSS